MTERDADPAADDLLALVDRLGLLLDENDLAELEIEAAGTRVLLRRAGSGVPAAAAVGVVAGEADAEHLDGAHEHRGEVALRGPKPGEPLEHARGRAQRNVRNRRRT